MLELAFSQLAGNQSNNQTQLAINPGQEPAGHSRWLSLYFRDFCTFLWENLTEIKLPEHAPSYDLELGLPITAIRQGIYVKIKRTQMIAALRLQHGPAKARRAIRIWQQISCSSSQLALLLTPFPAPRDSPRFCLIPARSAPDKN